MSALSVTQDDADRAEAAKVEVEQIMLYGAAVSGVEAISAVPDLTTVPSGQLSGLRRLASTLAISIVRLARNGTSVFPARLPSYNVAGVPDAASFPGALIFVTNGASGSATVAFSDGTDWLRTDTRSPISSV